MSTAHTTEELRILLTENIEFLRRSCESFDHGYTSEAKRLAVTARVLIHNTKQSKSLLSQLKLAPNMGFLCTARPISEHVIFGGSNRLVQVLVGTAGVNYQALADKIPSRPGHNYKVQLFATWWNEEVIITDNSSFTRKDIVLNLSNKVGGAHVDPKLNDAFAELLRNNPLGITGSINDEESKKLPDIELHTMRQIAHKIIISIALGR